MHFACSHIQFCRCRLSNPALTTRLHQTLHFHIFSITLYASQSHLLTASISCCYINHGFIAPLTQLVTVTHVLMLVAYTHCLRPVSAATIHHTLPLSLPALFYSVLVHVTNDPILTFSAHATCIPAVLVALKMQCHRTDRETLQPFICKIQSKR